MNWKHNALADDLAEHLRSTSDRMVWTDMQLGPSGSPRPDCYSIAKSYARFVPLAYECKVSVSDFRADVTVGKWQSYLKFAAGVIFAVPQGLIQKADVPPGCGLMVRGESGWRAVKGPTLGRFETLPRDAWMKLLIDGVRRHHNDDGKRWFYERRAADAIEKKYGKDLAVALSDRDGALSTLRYQQARAQEAEREARDHRERILKVAHESAERDARRLHESTADLCKALGLPADAAVSQIVVAARVAAERLDRDEEISRLRRIVDNVQIAIEKATRPMPSIARAA